MKTIIAATNYTELSENAVEYAAYVAKINNARLILMNDFSVPVEALNGRLPGDRIEELFIENKHMLTKKSALLSDQYKIEVIPAATFSVVEDEIKNLVEQYQADLLVMGMASKNIEQDLLGNTTTSVIKNLNVSVLAVPSGVKFPGTKRVLFACDVLNGISELLLSRVKSLSLHIGAEVEILLINETVQELKAKGLNTSTYNDMKHHLEGINYNYKDVASDSIINSIRAEIESFKADLLIMVPQKHGFWDSLIHRSKTRIMASGISIPLLSIPL